MPIADGPEFTREEVRLALRDPGMIPRGVAGCFAEDAAQLAQASSGLLDGASSGRAET